MSNLIYEIRKGNVQVPYDKRHEIKEGISIYDESPETICQFDDFKEAKEFFESSNYMTCIEASSGYANNRFFNIEEYFIEKFEKDDDGDCIPTGDYSAFSHFPVSPIELRQLGIIEKDAEDIDDLNSNLYIHTDEFDKWLDDNLKDDLADEKFIDDYVLDLSNQFENAKGYSFDYRDKGIVKIDSKYELSQSQTKSNKKEMFAYQVVLYPTSWNNGKPDSYDKVFDLTPNEEYRRKLENKTCNEKQKHRNDFTR